MSKRYTNPPTEANIDLDRRLFNDVYFPHLLEVYNREVYYGGSGSGKSTFIGGQKLPLQMTIMEGRNLVCLRRQKTDCIKSCFSEIKNGLRKLHLLDYWIVKENPDHVMINKINGNTILFEGVDNIEDIKSIKFEQRVDGVKGDSNLTDVWYEEVNAEETQDTINELARRMRDMNIKSRIILSFNPVSRSHWLFEYVTKELPSDNTVDKLILKTTYKDNRFLPSDYGALLERTKYTNPYDYNVYCLGNWGTLGDTVFDKNKIQNRLDKLVNLPVRRCEFFYDIGDNKLPVKDSYKLFDNPVGDIAIFKMPEYKHPYVMAVDTAGEGSDYYVAHVMDNISGEQVARFRSQKSPDLCIWQIYGMAVMYNYALICPEINFDSWIIKALLLLDYDNIYRMTSSTEKTYQKQEDKYGWRTGPNNRSMMISDFIYWSGQYMDCINDVDTLNEMLTFTKQEKKLKGIWMGAEPGEHDDLVIGFCILLQARVQQSMEFIPDRKKLEGFWTRDDLETAVDEGRIDRETADEYIKEKGYYCESYETRFKRERRKSYVH